MSARSISEAAIPEEEEHEDHYHSTSTNGERNRVEDCNDSIKPK